VMSRGPFEALSDHEEGYNSRDGEGLSCSSAMRPLLRKADLWARSFEVVDVAIASQAFGSLIPKLSMMPSGPAAGAQV
jgi:hypothetical protein